MTSLKRIILVEISRRLCNVVVTSQTAWAAARSGSRRLLLITELQLNYHGVDSILLDHLQMSAMNPLNPPVRILMGPGPSDIHPRVLEAMAKPTVGHLDPYYL